MGHGKRIRQSFPRVFVIPPESVVPGELEDLVLQPSDVAEVMARLREESGWHYECKAMHALKSNLVFVLESGQEFPGKTFGIPCTLAVHHFS